MRVLVVRDFMKNFYLIRNCFGVFKNQPLPKKFVYCQNMREREECSYQNACLFSHSITELAIWQLQKQGENLFTKFYKTFYKKSFAKTPANSVFALFKNTKLLTPTKQKFFLLLILEKIRDHEAVLKRLLQVTKDDRVETDMVLA